MVVAALVHALRQGECCICSRKYKIVSMNPFYHVDDKDDRRDRRRAGLNVWLNSTGDDLDLVSDWWFFLTATKGLSLGGDIYDGNAILLGLFVSCCLASVTWMMSLVKLSCTRAEDYEWKWLPILILMVEDIPQVVLTFLLQAQQGRFDQISNLGIFNIMTSIYSLSIRMASQICLNCFYGCERVDDDNDNNDDDHMESGTNDRVAYYSGSRR